MKHAALAAALLGVACAQAAAAQDGLTRTTTASISSFSDCFIAMQDKGEAPWAFVPREGGGGTFSSVGADGAGYFVHISDRGETREVRFHSANDGILQASVTTAIDRCGAPSAIASAGSPAVQAAR